MRFLTPILTGILTVMSLYAANAYRLEWSQLPLPLLIAVLTGAFFALIFSLLPYTSKNMPIIASGFTLAVLMWNAIGIYAVLAILIISTALSVIKLKVKLTPALNVILAIGLLVSVGQSLFGSNWNQSVVKAEPAVSKGLPSIYFICPDRMTSIDGIRECGIDTTEFVNYLHDNGFYVNEDATTLDPYRPGDEDLVSVTRTCRFISSLLNDGVSIPFDIDYKGVFNKIQNNTVIPELHNLGYTTYNVASWFTYTANIGNFDYTYQYKAKTPIEFLLRTELGLAFWQRTLYTGFNFYKLIPSASIVNSESSRHLWQAGQITDIAGMEGQKFVFSHILLPHEPFVWTADGELQFDTKLSQLVLYIQQLSFTCNYLMKLTGDILKADPDAIIIIQSDEGMGFKRPVELNLGLSDTQWFGTFSAWRIPGVDDSQLENIEITQILGYLVEYLK